MKSNLFKRYPLHILILLILGLLLLIFLLPSGEGSADANLPTITPTSEPTATAQTDNGQPLEATATLAAPVFPTTAPDNPLMATQPPPPTSVTGGLSLLNRILLMVLAVVTVGVMGVIVYAIYYRTRREGSDY
jgi:hypothetical protein